MTQAAIILPNTLTSTAGLRRLMELIPLPGSTTNGFPAANIQDLFLFNDESGTAPANSISGRGAGAIAHPVASLNSYAWSSGGGGLQLNGTELMQAPALVLGSPWSVAIGCKVAGGAIATGTGYFGLFSFLNGTTLDVYGGPAGAGTWTGATSAPFAARSYNAGGSNNAFSNALTFLNKGLVLIITYDGVSALTAGLYDKTGALVSSVSPTIALSVLTASGGASQQPCLGIANATFNSGQTIFESMATYTRVLAADDIKAIVAANVALATARGRAW